MPNLHKFFLFYYSGEDSATMDDSQVQGLEGIVEVMVENGELLRVVF